MHPFMRDINGNPFPETLGPPGEFRDANKEREAMRTEILKIAAACARFQHLCVDELTQDDLKQFGDYAKTLKRIYDWM